MPPPGVFSRSVMRGRGASSAEAQAAFETARTDYLTAYGQLDRLCGGTLSALTAQAAAPTAAPAAVASAPGR